MVNAHRLPRDQPHLLGAIALVDDVYGRASVMDDLDVSRRVPDQFAIEPLQVLAHDPPRNEVVLGYLRPASIDAAGVPFPSIAPADQPLVEAHPVAVIGGVVTPGIQGNLAAGGVHDQIVGLIDRVDPGPGSRGLDHVDPDRPAARFPLAGGPDDPLQHAESPRAEPDDGHLGRPGGEGGRRGGRPRAALPLRLLLRVDRALGNVVPGRGWISHLRLHGWAAVEFPGVLLGALRHHLHARWFPATSALAWVAASAWSRSSRMSSMCSSPIDRRTASGLTPTWACSWGES